MTFDNRAYMRAYRLKHKDDPEFRTRWRENQRHFAKAHKNDPEFLRQRRESARSYYVRHKNDLQYRERQRRSSLARAHKYREDPQYRQHIRQMVNQWVRKQSPEYKEHKRAVDAQRIVALWDAVFDKFGSQCSGCGIGDRTVLQLHHVNGNGVSERKRMRKCQILKRAVNHPEEYALVCANCHIRIHRQAEKGQP